MEEKWRENGTKLPPRENAAKRFRSAAILPLFPNSLGVFHTPVLMEARKRFQSTLLSKRINRRFHGDIFSRPSSCFTLAKAKMVPPVLFHRSLPVS